MAELVLKHTFITQLPTIELNDELSDYVEKMIEVKYYGRDNVPEGGFQVNEITYAQLNIQVLYEDDSDPWSVKHIPFELIVTVEFEDDEEVHEYDVVIKLATKKGDRNFNKDYRLDFKMDYGYDRVKIQNSGLITNWLF